MIIENSNLVDLRQGSYWRTREQIVVPEIIDNWRGDEDRLVVIPAGQVLLLQSIRDVEHEAHTIIVRPHPSVYGRRVYRAASYRDGKPYSWFSEDLTEYRFLTQDFLNKFEIVENPEPIRAKELAEAQDHVRQLQQRLLDGQSNPEVLHPVLESGIKAWEEEKKLDPEQAEHIATMSTTTALVPTLTEGHVDNLKLRAKREHKLATIRAGWIKERVEEVGEAVKALMPYMEEQAATALSHTEDVIRKVQGIQKGIESLDLYIGKDVVVETLKTGKSAPEGLPLTIAQRKLFMIEEFSVWADVDEQFDFHKDNSFLKASLRMNPCSSKSFRESGRSSAWSHTATTRTTRTRGLTLPKPDQQRGLSSDRDGENLHRVFSPMESHLHALQLFPSRNEVDGISLAWRAPISTSWIRGIPTSWKSMRL